MAGTVKAVGIFEKMQGRLTSHEHVIMHHEQHCPKQGPEMP